MRNDAAKTFPVPRSIPLAAAIAVALAAPAALHAQPAAQEGAGPALHRVPLIGLASPDRPEAGASRRIAAVYRRADFLRLGRPRRRRPLNGNDYNLGPASWSDPWAMS